MEGDEGGAGSWSVMVGVIGLEGVPRDQMGVFIVQHVATDVATQVSQFNMLLNKLCISLPPGIQQLSRGSLQASLRPQGNPTGEQRQNAADRH